MNFIIKRVFVAFNFVTLQKVQRYMPHRLLADFCWWTMISNNKSKKIHFMFPNFESGHHKIFLFLVVYIVKSAAESLILLDSHLFE